MFLQSNTTTINYSPQQVFPFFLSPQNFKILMPSSLSHFETYHPSGFIFSLSGMPKVFLELTSSAPHSLITYNAKEGKLPFELSVNISQLSENKSTIFFKFNTDMPAFVAAIIKNPLQNLINHMAVTCQDVPFENYSTQS